MSRVSAAVIGRSGMALPGTTLCGVEIHRCRFAGLFASSPAITARSATFVSGGQAAFRLLGQGARLQCRSFEPYAD